MNVLKSEPRNVHALYNLGHVYWTLFDRPHVAMKYFKQYRSELFRTNNTVIIPGLKEVDTLIAGIKRVIKQKSVKR